MQQILVHMVRKMGTKIKTKTMPPFKIDIKDPIEKESQEINSINSSTKTSFEIEEMPLFGSETSTEDATKEQEDYQFVCTTKYEEQKKTEANSFWETVLQKNKDINNIKKGSSQKETNSPNATRSSNHSFKKSSSYSGSGATHMVLNLITCGIVDTNDSAVTVIKRKDGTTASMMNISSALDKQRDKRKEGSKSSYNANNNKRIPAAYKFVNGPYCS